MVSLTDVAEFSRLGRVVGGAPGADSAQPVTENGAGVTSDGVQGVAEVTERGQQSTSSTTLVVVRRQAVEQLGVTTAQRQSVAAPSEEHRRQVAVRSTQRLGVACDNNRLSPSHSSTQNRSFRQRRRQDLVRGGAQNYIKLCPT